jgi:hypothetical protein
MDSVLSSSNGWSSGLASGRVGSLILAKPTFRDMNIRIRENVGVAKMHRLKERIYI